MTMGNPPPDLKSTQVKIDKIVYKKDRDFKQYYSTMATAGFMSRSGDFRIVFQLDDASGLQNRINVLGSPEEKQVEVKKGMDVIELCEIILPERAAQELFTLFQRLAQEKFE